MHVNRPILRHTIVDRLEGTSVNGNILVNAILPYQKKKKDQKNYTQYTIPRQIARPPGGLERGLTDAANCHLRTAVFFSLGKSLLLPTVQCSLGTSDGSFSWRLVRGETPTHCQPSSGGV